MRGRREIDFQKKYKKEIKDLEDVFVLSYGALRILYEKAKKENRNPYKSLEGVRILPTGIGLLRAFYEEEEWGPATLRDYVKEDKTQYLKDKYVQMVFETHPFHERALKLSIDLQLQMAEMAEKWENEVDTYFNLRRIFGNTELEVFLRKHNMKEWKEENWW